MSNVAILKINVMKSTLKVTYTSSVENESVIKIVIPLEILNEEEPEDVRDKHLRDFYKPPLSAYPSTFFEIKSSFMTEEPNAVLVQTIGAIKSDRELYTFRHSIINRIVPYDNILLLDEEKRSINKEESKRPKVIREDEYNKIHTFFNWLESLDDKEEII